MKDLKTRQVNIALTESEYNQLQEVADQEERTISNTARMLFLRGQEAYFQPYQPKDILADLNNYAECLRRDIKLSSDKTSKDILENVLVSVEEIAQKIKEINE